MTVTTRLLTLDDREAMATIIRSRAKIMSSTEITENMRESMVSVHTAADNFFGHRGVVGLLEDDVLDAFIIFDGLDGVPCVRADDPERSEPSALFRSIYTMKKPGRNPLHVPWVSNFLIETMEARGIYTHWNLLPITFTGWRENPAFTKIQNYVRVIVETVEVGHPAVDPFVAQYILRGVCANEPLSIRKSTLPDEFRT